ncbi:cupin domain-containing protein [Demequina sp.]|uniref:cupin domain-containing protein n=1 Tax=Demequina sp. TaxID=2050685 RepID=UPI003D0F76D4
MVIPETAASLGLEPHPEGGWFRRIYTSRLGVATDAGERPTATCIHYLLTPGDESAWHVVTSDELWLWHGPGTLELALGGDSTGPSGNPTLVRLGGKVAEGEVPACLVPANTWQAARLAGAEECLVSCMVSPGFDFADWRLA